MYNTVMGILYLVSTPLGNLEDISRRAMDTLRSAEVILCEDTRRTGLLLSSLHIEHSALMTYHDRIEAARLPEIVSILESGKNIALVSDAGTPLIADPGFLLVRECRKRSIPVRSIPGPSAFLSALTTSGFPTNHLVFLGFPPEKPAHRTELFRLLKSTPPELQYTYSMYIAPHKLFQTLNDMQKILGEIDLYVIREITKKFEADWQGKISEAIAQFTHPKGEFVVVFKL
jgi:16S rRNA (cytidine1402-2'-O)-methyltransferase